jgi:hypothetical protein
LGAATEVWATAAATEREEPPSVAALDRAVAAASELLLKVLARELAAARASPPLLRPWYTVLPGPEVGAMIL